PARYAGGIMVLLALGRHISKLSAGGINSRFRHLIFQLTTYHLPLTTYYLLLTTYYLLLTTYYLLLTTSSQLIQLLPVMFFQILELRGCKACHFTELGGEVGCAAVAQFERHFAQGPFIIDEPFFDALYFLENEVL